MLFASCRSLLLSVRWNRAVDRAVLPSAAEMQPGRRATPAGVWECAWCLSWWLIIHVGTGGFPTVQGRRGKEEKKERERGSWLYSPWGDVQQNRVTWSLNEGRSLCMPELLLALDVDTCRQSGLSATKSWNKTTPPGPLCRNIKEKMI